MKYLITILLLIFWVNGFGQKDSTLKDAKDLVWRSTDSTDKYVKDNDFWIDTLYHDTIIPFTFIPNPNFAFTFFDGKKRYEITMKNKDLGKLAKLFSEFLKSKGIKNTLKISKQY